MVTYFQEKDIVIDELIKLGKVTKSDHGLAIINIGVYYPTLQRNNILTKKYVNDMAKILKKVVSDKLAYEVFKDSSKGPMIFMGINEEVETVKRLMTYFEDNHVLGRWMLIEVYDNITNTLITRESLDINERKCPICHDTFKNCIENQSHSVFEIIREINRSYVEFKEGMI